MMPNEKDDDWNFEVKNVKTQEENIERQRRKARLSEKVNKNETKRSASDLVEKSNQKMRVGESSPNSRKSRSKMAEEMRKAELPSFTDLMAHPAKRAIAFVIDASLIIGVIGTSLFFWEKIEFYILQLMREKSLDQTLAPEQFKLYVMSAIVLSFYALFIALPACISHRSIGKSIVKISIHSSDEDKGIGFVGIFIREFVVKPISVATIMGPLICLFNPERKTLHDHIVKTVVMKD